MIIVRFFNFVIYKRNIVINLVFELDFRFVKLKILLNKVINFVKFRFFLMSI